jgi:hypothetical protein
MFGQFSFTVPFGLSTLGLVQASIRGTWLGDQPVSYWRSCGFLETHMRTLYLQRFSVPVARGVAFSFKQFPNGLTPQGLEILTHLS